MWQKTTLISLLLTIIFIGTAFAGVPQVISYQGILTDGSGDPVADGSYQVKFIIWNNPSATSPSNEKWNSGFKTISTLGGLFSYDLGSGTPFLPHNLFSDTLNWLGISVGTDGEIAPRTKMTSVTFAYHALRADSASYANQAGNANNLDGINSLDFVQQSQMNSHAGSQSVHHVKTTSAADLTSGTLEEGRLPITVIMQDDMASHSSAQSVHHVKTTSASDLTSGTLADARLSSNIARLDAENTFSATNVFDGTFRIGDSALYANSGNVLIGHVGPIFTSNVLVLSREWNIAAERRGQLTIVDNNNSGSGDIFAHLIYVDNNLSSTASRYGGRAYVGDAANTAGNSYGFRASAYGGASAYGIYGYAYGGDFNYAGYFSGGVNITGFLAKGGGAFKIDHPLDPQNKYLQHSFVESPDMMNIYNGNIVTDNNGQATVSMPDYFSALNRDFRYQLTVIGEFAQAIIGEKISNGKFVIRTDKPNVEVSWQVTGVRQDKWAEANRIQVELDKTGDDLGKYLHWEEYDVSPEQAVGSEQLLEDRAKATSQSRER